MENAYKTLSQSEVPLVEVLNLVQPVCKHYFIVSKFNDREYWCVKCNEKRSQNYFSALSIKETEEELATRLNGNVF